MKVCCDTEGRELTDERRYAPTSVPLRRKPCSRSPETLFHFTGIPIQRGIEPMQAVVTAPRAAQTHNLHRAGGRFGVAFVLVRLRALDTAGVLGRTSSLFRAALVGMSLQELAYQILAPPVQFPFEFALAHLPGFAGREEGFGIREDSIGRCARGSPRGIDARDAGSGHVECTSLESCRHSHRRSASLPTAPYQNAARMFRRERARGGQTDGVRHRFEARLAAGKTRVRAGLVAVPPK